MMRERKADQKEKRKANATNEVNDFADNGPPMASDLSLEEEVLAQCYNNIKLKSGEDINKCAKYIYRVHYLCIPLSIV